MWYFPLSAWHRWLGYRKGIWLVKKLGAGSLVVMIWVELYTTLLERLVSKITYNMLLGTLNPTYWLIDCRSLIQVCRMWKVFPAQPSPVRTQTDSLRQGASVQRLRQTIHAEPRPRQTQQNSQRRETVPMFHLWQGVQRFRKSSAAHERPRRRRAGYSVERGYFLFIAVFFLKFLIIQISIAPYVIITSYPSVLCRCWFSDKESRKNLSSNPQSFFYGRLS